MPRFIQVNTRRSHLSALLWDCNSTSSLQARQLEHQIDAKLVSFSKLGTNFGSSSTTDRAPLLGGDGHEPINVVRAEIADLLARLAQVRKTLTEAKSYDTSVGSRRVFGLLKLGKLLC